MFKVEAVVGNTGFMPTNATSEFMKLKLATDIEITLSGAEIADGKAVCQIPQLDGYGSVRAMYSFFGPGNYEANPLCRKVQWYVHGAAGDEVTLTATSQKAGVASVTVTL